MGLFKTKKKTIVGNSIVRVVEDENLPDMLQDAMTRAVFTGIGAAPAITQGVMSGSFRNFEKYYRYARDGHYYHGLPSARIRSNKEGTEIIKKILGVDSDAVDYIHFRPLNNFHIAWNWLDTEQDYLPIYGCVAKLSKAKGRLVFLEKIEAYRNTSAEAEPGADVNLEESMGPSTELIDASFQPTNVAALLDELNIAVPSVPEEQQIVDPLTGEVKAEIPKAGDVDSPLNQLLMLRPPRLSVKRGVNLTEGFKVHYVWIDENGEEAQSSKFVSLAWVDTDFECYMARYIEDDVKKHWTYFPGTGTHPELDNLYDRPEYVNPGTYFPFVVFRDGKWGQAGPGTPWFESASEMLSLIGIDYEDLGNQIHADQQQIKDVNQVALVNAIPLNTDDPDEIEYLWRYFRQLYSRLPERYQGTLAGESSKIFRSVNNAGDEHFAMEFTDANMRMIFSFDGISRSSITGQLKRDPRLATAGNPDAVSPTTGQPTPYDAYDDWGLVGAVETELVSDWFSADPNHQGNDSTRVRQDRHYIRRQMTPWAYEEICIINANMRYDIRDGKSVNSGGEDPRCMIPLDYYIVKSMSPFKREQIYHRSLHLIFNSFVVEKTKFYEKGWFKVVLAVVAIVIVIYTWRADIAAAVATATTATGAALAVIMIILEKILISMAIGFVLRKVVDVVGLEVAGIVAAVVIAAAFYFGDAEGAVGYMEHLTAENLLVVGHGLADGYVELAAEEYQDVMDELAQNQLLQEKKWDELEQAIEDSGMNKESLIDPYIFIGKQPIFIPHEGPDDYFNRTVHSGNIGANALNIIENYVEQSLRLPETMPKIGTT